MSPMPLHGSKMERNISLSTEDKGPCTPLCLFPANSPAKLLSINPWRAVAYRIGNGVPWMPPLLTWPSLWELLGNPQSRSRAEATAARTRSTCRQCVAEEGAYAASKKGADPVGLPVPDPPLSRRSFRYATEKKGGGLNRRQKARQLWRRGERTGTFKMWLSPGQIGPLDKGQSRAQAEPRKRFRRSGRCASGCPGWPALLFPSGQQTCARCLAEGGPHQRSLPSLGKGAAGNWDS